MAPADGERLATVTYLPGVFPASDLAHRSPSASAPSDDHESVEGTEQRFGGPRRLPTFGDFDRDTNGRAADHRDGSALGESVERHPAGKGRARRLRDDSAREGEFDRISNVSMHALTRRGMSSQEMHDLLASREFDEDAIAAEIDRLERVGLLDDVALGETLVRTLRERKGLGRTALIAELRRRKLDPDAIGAALETLADDEFDRALVLAVKRAPQLRVHDRDTAKRRLVAFLMRKGYSGSMSAAAVDRVLGGGYGADEEARTGPVFR